VGQLRSLSYLIEHDKSAIARPTNLLGARELGQGQAVEKQWRSSGEAAEKQWIDYPVPGFIFFEKNPTHDKYLTHLVKTGCCLSRSSSLHLAMDICRAIDRSSKIAAMGSDASREICGALMDPVRIARYGNVALPLIPIRRSDRATPPRVIL
jgi:hypothetical protein